MKRFGFLLVSILILTAVNAQNQPLKERQDTVNQVQSTNDSLTELYRNEKLDPKEAILLQKLSPEQIIALEKQKMENERHLDMPLPAWAITLIVTAPFVMVIFIVFLSTKADKTRDKMRYDLYLKSIEAGQPVPEKFFDAPEKKSSVSNLQRGALWLAAGLGVVVFGLVEHKTVLTGLGAIPAFVGLAYLVVYFIEKKHSSNTPTIDE